MGMCLPRFRGGGSGRERSWSRAMGGEACGCCMAAPPGLKQDLVRTGNNAALSCPEWESRKSAVRKPPAVTRQGLISCRSGVASWLQGSGRGWLMARGVAERGSPGHGSFPRSIPENAPHWPAPSTGLTFGILQLLRDHGQAWMKDRTGGCAGDR